ncbi:MAG TPA: TrbG/VirB9 family P-type conjugative transfer protein [Bryobacteraceae bacterium]|nr:TrbG/VirB9 family P-type conjugative transfer protein [Bryobacteraceae bacterium]
MRTQTMSQILLSVALCGFLKAADAPISSASPEPPGVKQRVSKNIKPAEGAKDVPRGGDIAQSQLFVEAADAARTVHYGERDVVRVKARLRFTTLIVLPKAEQILDFVCGDKEYWVVNGAQNFAYVKPAKAGGRTNLNLVTASGNVYSFVLTETDAEPDLKVFVEPRDESMISAANGAPRFFSARQVEDYRQQVEIAKAETREARQAAGRAIESEVSSFRSQYPTQMRFDYRFQANQRPFMVTGMFHDGRFTYIQAKPQEVPALYEVKDGKPNLVQFQFNEGTYVVDKVMDEGYLAIGKQRLPFYRAHN